MICERCKRRLKPEAVSCICGWTLSAAKPPEIGVACAFSDCSHNAKVRVWTATGWANVCLTHYEQVEILSRVSESPIVRKIREAHQRRQAVRETVKEAA